VAGRIRSSVRRHERRWRLAALAAHPNTNPAVARRIRSALSNAGLPPAGV
jgi:DNA-binding IscR family transcriptional regulator